MIKDFKYIIKRILIGVGVGFILFILKYNFVNAAVTDLTLTMNNTTMSTNTKIYIGSAQNINVSIKLKNQTIGTVGTYEYEDYRYGYIAVCSAFGSYENRYINTVSSSSPYTKNVSVINSTVGCTIPTTSSYRSTARVVYITYALSFDIWDFGSGNSIGLAKADIPLAWYQPTSNEFSLISFGFGSQPFNFNETTDPKVLQNDTIISQNETQINQNQTIINQNTSINNGINDVNSSMNNSNVDSPYSSINDAKNNVATNGVITQLVTLPVTLFQKILNGVNGSCVSYNMGSLYGTDIILPCIVVSNYIGSSLWSVIDVLISGLFVWSISRKMIKVFNNFSTLKEGDVLSD